MSGSAASSAYLGWLGAALAARVDDAGSGSEGGSIDAVLGYATGYDAHDIAPFVRSLRAVFDGEIALVVDDRNDIRALFDLHRVRLLTPAKIDGWEPHAVMARFAAFDRHLSGRTDIRSVLITDVRDVLFQKSPFAPQPTGLEAFVEGDRLGDHAFNMKYLRALIGEAMAEALATAPSVCVGTVMGPRAEIIRFCRLVLMLAAIPRSEFGGAFGADQAACNIAIHMGLLKAEVNDNYGRVATIGLTPGETLGLKDGQVVNPDGTISAIVHQHDRHPQLAEAMHQRWGEGLEVRERVRPKSAAERRRKMRDSFMRRLPELR
ncbi:hypothetical protein [Brevundimonas sp. NIBR11]|uniref:hypothetical protein n=1 Tax=Brevundimonas sp. NIBR11 TaxID=3015999 RepID=UPI0022F07370|nr:hypothetical protein [Brevundimonas sp. NIBR11]WGM30064.1 hypothetical protein KKHFBJBL_00279 [Brevundimonas sp. NIBR11]